MSESSLSAPECGIKPYTTQITKPLQSLHSCIHKWPRPSSDARINRPISIRGGGREKKERVSNTTQHPSPRRRLGPFTQGACAPLDARGRRLAARGGQCALCLRRIDSATLSSPIIITTLEQVFRTTASRNGKCWKS